MFVEFSAVQAGLGFSPSALALVSWDDRLAHHTQPMLLHSLSTLSFRLWGQGLEDTSPSDLHKKSSAWMTNTASRGRSVFSKGEMQAPETGAAILLSTEVQEPRGGRRETGDIYLCLALLASLCFY